MRLEELRAEEAIAASRSERTRDAVVTYFGLSLAGVGGTILAAVAAAMMAEPSVMATYAGMTVAAAGSIMMRYGTRLASA